MLLALASIWGSSFMFIKVAVRDMAPATAVLGRVAIGALLLAAFVPIRMPAREALDVLRRCWLPLTLAGVLNSAVPFLLLFWAETRIDSGAAAVLQATAPLFTALLAFVFFHAERVGGQRLAGFVAGLGGVALLVGAQPSGSILAALAVLGSAFCYSIAALYTARRLPDEPTLVVALGSLIAASLASLPAGLAQLPGDVPGWKSIASVIVLGVAGTALAYLLYYAVITGAGASRAILITYLVPPMALVYGAIFLDEAITVGSLGGLALILAGVALGTGAVALRRRRRAAADSLAE